MIMNKNDVNLRNRLWDLVSSGLPIDYDIDILRKILLLNLVTFVGSLFLGFLAIVGFLQGDMILGVVEISLILFLMWLVYHLRKKRNYQFVGLIGTIITGIFYLFLIAHGGVERTAYPWALTYPLIVLYLLGKRLGSYFSVLFLCVSGIVFYAGIKIPFVQQYDISMIIRFFAVYAIIHIIAFLNEHVREKVQHRLTQRTDDLIDSNQKLMVEIEERKRIEKALRNSESFFDNVIESIQDAIIVLNTDLTIRHTNGIMVQWYRHAKPLIGEKCYESFHHRDQPCDGCPVLECLRSGKPQQRIVHGIFGSPEKCHEGFCFPIKDSESGKITGVVEIIRDITQTKQLERQLARAQKMEAIGTLAGGVAHDLNNILSGIVSYPELLLMELPEDSPMRAPIETIQTSGKKAAAIVQDMLTLARRGVPSKEVVNLTETVSAFLNSLEYGNIQKHHPDVSVTSDLRSDLLNVTGSPVHLSKSVMNLVSNAVEAITGPGKVSISARNRYIDKIYEGYETIPEGEYVVLTVSDSGSGISSGDLHQIFEPFYTKKIMGRSGTGLGMAVVWGTVKDMQGFVDIQTSIGVGTKVSLYFPATRDELIEKEKATPVEKYMGSEKILVIDDMKEQRDIASAMLRKIGYSVAVVSSGEESIQYLAQNHADVVVLDMVMDPGMDGLETYKEIIKFHPAQKAVIASGYSETGRVKEAQRLGAGQYVRKPYTLEKLGLSVRSELDK